MAGLTSTHSADSQPTHLDRRSKPRPVRRSRQIALVHLPQRLPPQRWWWRARRPHHSLPAHRHRRHRPHHRLRHRRILYRLLQPHPHAAHPHLEHLRSLDASRPQHLAARPQLRHQHHHPLPAQLSRATSPHVSSSACSARRTSSAPSHLSQPISASPSRNPPSPHGPHSSSHPSPSPTSSSSA